jgi:hypothetical protein
MFYSDLSQYEPAAPVLCIGGNERLEPPQHSTVPLASIETDHRQTKSPKLADQPVERFRLFSTIRTNAWYPRLAAAMMALGSACQTNGLGSRFYSSTKRLMAAGKAMTEWKTPRFRRRLVSWAKKLSTALSQEQEVGVKWKVQREWRWSHRLTLAWLWSGVVVEDDVDDLAGRHCLFDGIEEADELLMAMALQAASEHRPSRTLSAANKVVVPLRL